jgi:hypothetical protein
MAPRPFAAAASRPLASGSGERLVLMSASLRPGQRQHETAAAARCQLGADGVSCAIAVRAAALQTGCSTASVHFSTLPARRSHFNLASATSHFYIAIPVRLSLL